VYEKCSRIISHFNLISWQILKKFVFFCFLTIAQLILKISKPRGLFRLREFFFFFFFFFFFLKKKEKVWGSTIFAKIPAKIHLAIYMNINENANSSAHSLNNVWLE
jgi:hypothetical protein